MWSKIGIFNEWINLAEFVHANTYLRKLKVTLIVIGLAWSNMGCVLLGRRILKSAIPQLKNKLMN